MFSAPARSAMVRPTFWDPTIRSRAHLGVGVLLCHRVPKTQKAQISKCPIELKALRRAYQAYGINEAGRKGHQQLSGSTRPGVFEI